MKKTIYQTNVLMELNVLIPYTEGFTNDGDLVLTIKNNSNLIYIVIHPDDDFALVGISKTLKSFLKFYILNNINEFNTDFKKLYEEYEEC